VVGGCTREGLAKKAVDKIHRGGHTIMLPVSSYHTYGARKDKRIEMKEVEQW
jgi:hypothetical protein